MGAVWGERKRRNVARGAVAEVIVIGDKMRISLATKAADDESSPGASFAIR